MLSSTLRRSFWRQRPIATSSQRFISSNHQEFAEGDIVLLRQVTDNSTAAILSIPLKLGKKIDTHLGKILHDDIIGSTTRKLVTSNKGTQYCVTFPTIEEYVTKVRRLVTPVYPLDAAVIVSLLDIHVNAPTESPVEIFEAGTGHGSLTLQLCRAIHAANPPGQPRGAIVHSIDISRQHSTRAKAVVAGFRRGIYKNDVDFYVGDPSSWIKEQLSQRGGKPFLTHALLDLPGTENYLASLSEALLPDGILGVFCPSVTQIGDCLKVIRKQRLQLSKESIVEFPPHAVGVGAGLRAWNVKFAVVRAKTRGKVEVEDEDGGVTVVETEARAEFVEGKEESSGSGVSPDTNGVQPKEIPAVDPGESEDVLVCRPSVGDRLVGGGFFGIFRKKGEC